MSEKFADSAIGHFDSVGIGCELSNFLNPFRRHQCIDVALLMTGLLYHSDQGSKDEGEDIPWVTFARHEMPTSAVCTYRT